MLRGTYDPLPSTYSQELRDIIGMMLTKDVASRPTANDLLQVGEAVASNHCLAISKAQRPFHRPVMSCQASWSRRDNSSVLTRLSLPCCVALHGFSIQASSQGCRRTLTSCQAQVPKPAGIHGKRGGSKCCIPLLGIVLTCWLRPAVDLLAYARELMNGRHKAHHVHNMRRPHCTGA